MRASSRPGTFGETDASRPPARGGGQQKPNKRSSFSRRLIFKQPKWKVETLFPSYFSPTAVLMEAHLTNLLTQARAELAIATTKESELTALMVSHNENQVRRCTYGVVFVFFCLVEWKKVGGEGGRPTDHSGKGMVALRLEAWTRDSAAVSRCFPAAVLREALTFLLSRSFRLPCLSCLLVVAPSAYSPVFSMFSI